MKQWYEQLFENYANQYEREVFTQGTSGEVDFIEAEIGRERSTRILDIGCGTGRHAIELTRRGYRVTGVDLSAGMLAKARHNAERAAVKVDFLQADARNLPFTGEFDLAIMLCEGAFPLMETDEMNYAILGSAARALDNDGKFILTTLNGLFPLFHSVKEFLNAGDAGGRSKQNTFDLMSFRDISTFDFIDDDGRPGTLHCNERYYIPSEIVWLLKSLGFGTVDIFGCTIGAFSRDQPLSTEHFEMLVVAQK